MSIIVSESNNTLLVPNQALTYQGFQPYVHVMSSDDVIQERLVQVGISDFQFTEITDGLSEGDQVVVSQGSAELSTEPDRPGGFMIPMGGRR